MAYRNNRRGVLSALIASLKLHHSGIRKSRNAHLEHRDSTGFSCTAEQSGGRPPLKAYTASPKSVE